MYILQLYKLPIYNESARMAVARSSSEQALLNYLKHCKCLPYLDNIPAEKLPPEILQGCPGLTSVSVWKHFLKGSDLEDYYLPWESETHLPEGTVQYVPNVDEFIQQVTAEILFKITNERKNIEQNTILIK